MSDLVAIFARAINMEMPYPTAWEEAGEERKTMCLAVARRSLLVMEAAGYAVVPVEKPTPEMLMRVYLDEGVNHEDAEKEWTAFMAARPKVTPP